MQQQVITNASPPRAAIKLSSLTYSPLFQVRLCLLESMHDVSDRRSSRACIVVDSFSWLIPFELNLGHEERSCAVTTLIS